MELVVLLLVAVLIYEGIDASFEHVKRINEHASVGLLYVEAHYEEIHAYSQLHVQGFGQDGPGGGGSDDVLYDDGQDAR